MADQRGSRKPAAKKPAAKRKPAAPRGRKPTAKEIEAAAKAQANDPINGLLVRRIGDGGMEQGFNTTVEPVGDVRLSEIESLLKLALKTYRERAGLQE